MVTRCVSCHLLCFHVWRMRHVGLIEPHMSDGTVRSRSQAHTHAHTHPICTSLCRKMGVGGRTRRASSILLFKQPSNSLWFLPFSLHMCHGSSQQVISPTRKQAKAADARDKILQKLIWRKDKKKREEGRGLTVSARFSRAGTLWNNSVHYACHYWLPNHTNQRPHCVDYLVNLLMPLSSIAGVNVPVFFFYLLLLGRCSVRLVICFKCFLGNENQRQEDCVIVKSFLLIQHREETRRARLQRQCRRGQANELHAPRHLLKYMTVWIMKEEEEKC